MSDSTRTRIAVAGLGYVGLPLACALAQRHRVVGIDVNARRAASVDRGQSPLAIPGIDEFLATRELDLSATTDSAAAYAGADVVIVAVPTDFDALTGRIDTAAVESVIDDALRFCPDALLVVKSTVPVGFTASLRERMPRARVVCCPEFLRESDALRDTLHPTRVLVGVDLSDDVLVADAECFAALLLACVDDADAPVLVTGSSEAEATKLFSNAYLALRVAFFNELDTYAERTGLEARQVIEGMGLDPRIGATYNNPGFGFGGYCLPKDTRQLLDDFEGTPQRIVTAIGESNDLRKSHVVDEILRRIDPDEATVGVFRLVMEEGGAGLRHSSLLDVIERLLDRGVAVILHEPLLGSMESFLGCAVENDLQAFKERSELIVANRYNHCLDDVVEKTYTRDAFGSS